MNLKNIFFVVYVCVYNIGEESEDLNSTFWLGRGFMTRETVNNKALGIEECEIWLSEGNKWIFTLMQVGGIIAVNSTLSDNFVKNWRLWKKKCTKQAQRKHTIA